MSEQLQADPMTIEAVVEAAGGWGNVTREAVVDLIRRVEVGCRAFEFERHRVRGHERSEASRRMAIEECIALLEDVNMRHLLRGERPSSLDLDNLIDAFRARAVPWPANLFEDAADAFEESAFERGEFRRSILIEGDRWVVTERVPLVGRAIGVRLREIYPLEQWRHPIGGRLDDVGRPVSVGGIGGVAYVFGPREVLIEADGVISRRRHGQSGPGR